MVEICHICYIFRTLLGCIHTYCLCVVLIVFRAFLRCFELQYTILLIPNVKDFYETLNIAT